MSHSLFILKDYGKINIALKEILLAKGIGRNKLCKDIASSYDLINRYYSNSVTRMCYILDCDLSEILVYAKPKETEIKEK